MTIPDEYMNDIVKNCPFHGELIENQVYRRNPPRNEIICKKCNNIRSNKYRYITIPIEVNERKCSRCRETKPKSDFKPYQWKLASPYCNLCRKANSTKDYHKNRSHFKNRFGITIEHYESILKSQNNLCAICKNPEIHSCKKYGSPKRLSVDHCHKTGSIRGILCQRCNQGIGSFCDNTDYLLNAYHYLKKSTVDKL